VGCRHHLLLEELSTREVLSTRGGTRPTSLRLNTEARGRGLAASAAERIVRRWMDDALELLFTMPWSCSLDVVDAYPEGLQNEEVAALFGVREQTVQELQHSPRVVDALLELKRIRDEGDG
jgi:hypothetical protein